MTRPALLATLSSNPSEIMSSVPVPQPPDLLTSPLPESKPADEKHSMQIPVSSMDVTKDRFNNAVIEAALSILNGGNGFTFDDELKSDSDYSVAHNVVYNNAIMQLENYLETRASFENWLEDAELLPYLQAASRDCFQENQENYSSQERLMAILQEYYLLPAIEKDEKSPEKAVVLLWRQEKVFYQDPEFIADLIDDILLIAIKPYPLIQTLLEIKDEKAITAVWCVSKDLITLANSFLKKIIRRIAKSSIDFPEAYSLIALFLQKGYLNFNDEQRQDLVKHLLSDVMTELCSLVRDSITCYYAQSILALLKIDKSFDFFPGDASDWKDSLFKKYQDTEHLEFKIGLSDVAAMMPKLLDFPQIQPMIQYSTAARVMIMTSLEPFFATVLIKLVESYLNPPPLPVEGEVDNHVLTQAVRHGQTFLPDNRSQKDDCPRAKISDFGLSKR